MSLINNMLKELEKKGEPTTYPVVLSYEHPPTSILQKYFFYLLIFLFVFLLVVLSFFAFQEKEIKFAKILPQQNVKTQVSPVFARDTKWNQSGLVTGMTVQVKDDMTEVSFLLNHPILYRLISNDIINRFSLVFDQTKIEAEVPIINRLNTALESISTQINQGDTIFHFFLRPGAMIKSVNINNENTTMPELVVAFQYKDKASDLVGKQNATPALVKIPAMQTLLLQQYQSALHDIEAGRYQAAIRQLASLLKISPRYHNARVSLAAVLIDQGLSKKAESIIDVGLQLDPDYVPFVELKARLLTTEGKIQQALNLLVTVSPSMDENPDYHAFMATLYERNNDDLLAIKLYKQLLAINPNKGNWWLGLGVSLDKIGQSKAALNAYSKALAEGHLNADAFTYLQNRLHALSGKTL